MSNPQSSNEQALPEHEQRLLRVEVERVPTPD